MEHPYSVQLASEQAAVQSRVAEADNAQLLKRPTRIGVVSNRLLSFQALLARSA